MSLSRYDVINTTFISDLLSLLKDFNALNPLSTGAFLASLFLNIENLTLTQFLRNGSTKLQSFVYHFVGNFKLLHDNVKQIS